MQISILTLMLALGVPGANSCTAQQQGLPRVGQTPPVATQGDEPAPAVADEEDADEPEEMDADDADAEMFEIAGAEAEAGGCPDAQQEKSDCKAHCEGSGSCQGGSDPMLGRRMHLGGVGGGDSLALDGQVLRLKEGELDGKVQKLTIQPGSTVILETKNGKQVVVRTQGLGGEMVNMNPASIPTLGALFARSPSNKQGQDDRVRELEQRVRELEAQLREREGQARTPGAFQLWAPQAHAEARARAEVQRAQSREMRERMSAQARDYAEQARRQAGEIRKQGEQLRKRMQEQAEEWRVHAEAQQPQDFQKWTFSSTPEASEPAPEPDVFVEAQPCEPVTPPVAPQALALPKTPAPPEPPAGAWWGGNTAGPKAPHFKAFKAPKAPKPGKAGSSEQAQEMQAMLSEMRHQMDEMREQMQALREELQRAPQRQLR